MATKRLCSIPDCGKPHASRGYCKKHAARFLKYGDANTLLKVRGRTCSVAGCDQPHDSHGFCGRHAMRWKRHSDPLGGGTSHGEPMTFLVDVAAKYRGDDCLIWPYGGTVGGRPQVHVGDTTRSAANMLCEILYGTPPTSRHEAAHSCGKGDEGCISPRHLSWKTPAENEADKLIHGTHQYGEQNPVAKLTAAQVDEIRHLRGRLRQREIAERYGISQSNVSMIQSGVTWRPVGLP